METNTNPSNKSKLSVALVVLMFLAVSLVAVGFAINSTLTINDNEFEDKYYAIDYTNKNGVAINDKISAVEITAYTETVIDEDETNGRTFHAYLNGATIDKTFYISLRSNDSVTFNVNTEVNLGAILSQFVTCSVEYDSTTFNAGEVVGVTLHLTIEADKDVSSITGIQTVDIANVDALESALTEICNETYTVTINAEPVIA